MKHNRRARLGNLSLCLAFVGALAVFPATAKAADAPLEYGWEEGFQYQCAYTVTATIRNSAEKTTGATVYSLLSSEAAATTEPEVQEECTGTAFAVSPDGLLVTCAHVVERAAEIKAQFGDKVYAAKVVKCDPGTDLAVLKVEARALPYLRFCDSDKVELAQEIRVAGYPLSSVLGESVKISRGTISGIIKRQDEGRFQIDARVNPGNSGGPLVDEQGRVVGVASELLTSQAIDSIGFAIPGNVAANLVRSAGSRPVYAPDAGRLEGPELAKKVTPAVAFLKVKVGLGSVAARRQHRLSFGSVFGKSGSRSRTHDSGRLVADSLGRVIDFDGDKMVPFLFESAGLIGIERLPGDDRKTWGSFRMVTFASSNSQSRSSVPSYLRPPSSRYRPRPPYYRPYPTPPRPPYPPSSRYAPPSSRYSPGRPETTVIKLMPAVEEVQYELVSETGTAVTIRKNYHLYAVAKSDDGRRAMDLKTEGTIIWDKTMGCPKKSEMKGQLTLSPSSVTVRVPLVITYEFNKKKPEPRKTPPPTTPTPRLPSTPTPDLADKTPKRPSARQVEPGAQPSSVKTAPSTTGLSKFNPDD